MADSAPEDVPQAAAENPEADAAVEPAAQAAAAADAKPDLDEVKRKFREALDAKRHSHSQNAAAGNHDASRPQGTRGRAGAKRSFRRKSG